jgi:4-carboxymuconolactone decarboxylase
VAHDAGTEDPGSPIVPLIAPWVEDEAVQRAFERVAVGRGGVANVFRAMASSPELLEVFAPIGAFFRLSSVLSDEIREAVILAVAHDSGCEYEWSQHVRIAKRLGLDHLNMIGLGEAPYENDVVNAAVTVGRATAQGAPLDPVAVESLVHALGNRGVVEVTVLAGYYGMLGNLIGAWHVPLDDGLTPEPMLPRRSDG